MSGHGHIAYQGWQAVMRAYYDENGLYTSPEQTVTESGDSGWIRVPGGRPNEND